MKKRRTMGGTFLWIEHLELRRLLSTGRISGVISQDSDGNSSGSIVGIEGATAYIDANNDGALNSGEPTAVTDFSGLFKFDGLPLGEYVVRHVAPAGLEYAWWKLGSDNESTVATEELAHVKLTAAVPRALFYFIDV